MRGLDIDVFGDDKTGEIMLNPRLKTVEDCGGEMTREDAEFIIDQWDGRREELVYTGECVVLPMYGAPKQWLHKFGGAITENHYEDAKDLILGMPADAHESITMVNSDSIGIRTVQSAIDASVGWAGFFSLSLYTGVYWPFAVCFVLATGLNLMARAWWARAPKK